MQNLIQAIMEASLMLLLQNYCAAEQFKISQHHHSVYFQRGREKTTRSNISVWSCRVCYTGAYKSSSFIPYFWMQLIWHGLSRARKQSTALCCMEPFVPDLTPGEELLSDPSGDLTKPHSLMFCTPTHHNFI